MPVDKKPLVLIVLDGWGYREGKEHNAIAEANTPFFDMLWHKYPHALLQASQQHVGLPEGTIGNSEVGHMTIGAGKVIDTDLVKISKAMKQKEFHANPSFLNLFEHVKKFQSTLHILGLVSPKGVHSHQEHLHGFLQAAKKAGIEKVAIHAFTDGRDAPPQSAAEYLKELEKLITDLGIGYIATASGRYYAMDRDNNWQRTDKVVAALFENFGKEYYAKNPSEVLSGLYKLGEVDEHLEPMIFFDDNGKSYPVQTNDGIFFFNFRSDRARQLSQKIAEKSQGKNLYFVTMTQYHPNLTADVAFPKEKVEVTLGSEIANAGLTQCRIAETDKYAHVTYFFNVGRQEPYEGEEDILIESKKGIKDHDEYPQMRAKEIADKAIENLQDGVDFILVNFANADLVGHTANKPAILTAVETIDLQLKRIVEKVTLMNGTAIITADHGNAEMNFDVEKDHKHTAHTTNLVPFILVSPNPTSYILHPTSNPSLADIAPTILQLMKLPKPLSMTGQSLLNT